MNNSIANRKLVWLGAVVLTLGAAAPVSHAFAQERLMTANIPFDFQQGSQTLKAGRYTVSLEPGQVMHLQADKVNSLSLSRTEINTKPSTAGKLVFHAYGNRYFLREVWQADKSEHLVLPRSNAEKRIQAEQAPAKRKGTEVALLEPIQ
jgi:hypothetical protein